jgi:hypothetical protein
MVLNWALKIECYPLVISGDELAKKGEQIKAVVPVVR